MPNQLIHSSSPYLLQHAHNPVNWFPWGEEALALARQANKPIIVSIGYSACHWCHVMERESFENEAIAALMNREFVCIKVDREERPDIDQIYMEAVQLMGLNGGWPLNVILTPAGDPFYGGTYFPPEKWAQMLRQVADAYRNHQAELEQSALNFRESLNRSELQRFGLMQAQDKGFRADRVQALVEQLAGKFDRQNGGMKGAPKFPMPCIYQFLLNAHAATQHPDALAHTLFTLDKIANGGIYDQLGGGFARYSVDDHWFAPHFEKMLYDNAQLLPLYAQAFALTGKARYREVAEETVAFVRRELTSPEGGFYSALDADSEGVEGKFYTWNVQEIKDLLGVEADWLLELYGCEMGGNWEHTNILHLSGTVEAFAEANGMAPEWLHAKLAEWKAALMTARATRIRPGLDDKVLASWNGLMISGLAEAGVLLGNGEMIALAQQNAHFLLEKMTNGAQLWHTYKDGKASIPGYLEDYAAVIQGLIALYQADFDERWLQQAHDCCEYALSYFFDEEEGMFFFTDEQSEKLIARKKEIFDNVIPASNSMMAHNLYRLGILLDRAIYRDLAADMTERMANLFDREVRYLTHWASLYALHTKEMAEVVIIGPEARAWAAELGKRFAPNQILMAAEVGSNLPLMQYREAIGGKTTIYVCYNKTCQLPVHSIAEALEVIDKR